MNLTSNTFIVSLIAPYIDQREDFKALIGEKNICEFYVYTTEPRERDHFKAIAYTPPVTTFIATTPIVFPLNP